MAIIFRYIKCSNAVAGGNQRRGGSWILLGMDSSFKIVQKKKKKESKKISKRFLLKNNEWINSGGSIDDKCWQQQHASSDTKGIHNHLYASGCCLSKKKTSPPMEPTKQGEKYKCLFVKYGCAIYM